jgi:hypothetical protein
MLATLGGILLALTPLALWIAWSPRVMGVVLAGAAVAAALVILCWPPETRRAGSEHGECA